MFFTFIRHVSVLAWVLRIRRRAKKTLTHKLLTVDAVELEAAHAFCIELTQAQGFSEDLKSRGSAASFFPAEIESVYRRAWPTSSGRTFGQVYPAAERETLIACATRSSDDPLAGSASHLHTTHGSVERTVSRL